MQCPLDGTALVIAERQGIEIDYCPQCRGVWLDRGELDKIIERAQVEMSVPRQPASAPATSEHQQRPTYSHPTPQSAPHSSGHHERDYSRQDDRRHGDSQYGDFRRDERPRDYDRDRYDERRRYDDSDRYASKKSYKKKRIGSWLEDLLDFD